MYDGCAFEKRKSGDDGPLGFPAILPGDDDRLPDRLGAPHRRDDEYGSANCHEHVGGIDGVGWRSARAPAQDDQIGCPRFLHHDLRRQAQTSLPLGRVLPGFNQGSEMRADVPHRRLGQITDQRDRFPSIAPPV